ncbi:MAG: TatD family hydrolase [Candidatus Nomurabacteria bacterium]|jgi:TatD family hydrolase|nr:TatD family hydrolase [Candidatus Nomurabacteria bacterium]
MTTISNSPTGAANLTDTSSFTDTHTHIYDPDFDGTMLLVSTFVGLKNPLYDGDEDSAEQVLALANQHDNACAILGIYPEFATSPIVSEPMPQQLDGSTVAVEQLVRLGLQGLNGSAAAVGGVSGLCNPSRQVAKLRQIIQSNPQKVKAIGEIGLDYHKNPSQAEIAAQKALFRAQLALAAELNLPVSLHIRGTTEHAIYSVPNKTDAISSVFADAFAILAEFSQIRGVCHSFTDSQASLDKALELGFYIGVNGIYTFNKDPELQSILNSIPLDRLLLETDAPYLTPTPHRKDRNKSSFLPLIAEKIAADRQLTAQEIAQITTKNAQKLFNI